MPTRLLAVPAALMALVLAAAPVQAEGDPVRGSVIAYTCTGCHGIPFYKNVYPTYTVPKLGGQSEGYIVAALEAYRSGDRAHPGMRAQARTLSDQDIADVAAYFVSLADPRGVDRDDDSSGDES